MSVSNVYDTVHCLLIITDFIGFSPLSPVSCFQHLFNPVTLDELIFWQEMHQVPKNQALFFQKLGELPEDI